MSRESGTGKLVNDKQHSVWIVPAGMKGLPQKVLLNFRLEFPKSDLTIYHPSGISEIFRQMVSTPGNQTKNQSEKRTSSTRIWHVDAARSRGYISGRRVLYNTIPAPIYLPIIVVQHFCFSLLLWPSRILFLCYCL